MDLCQGITQEQTGNGKGTEIYLYGIEYSRPLGRTVCISTPEKRGRAICFLCAESGSISLQLYHVLGMILCGLQTFNLTLQLMTKRMELSVPDSDLRQHEYRSERVRYSGYTCLSQMRIRIHFLIIFVRYSCLLLQLFIIFKA